MNAVRHKDSGEAEWGERDVVPLSPAVRKANRRNKMVPRACPWGSTAGNTNKTREAGSETFEWYSRGAINVTMLLFFMLD